MIITFESCVLPFLYTTYVPVFIHFSQVETVADSYMMTAGFPDTAERHAEAVTNMAFDMRREVTEFNKQGLHKDSLEV